MLQKQSQDKEWIKIVTVLNIIMLIINISPDINENRIMYVLI